MPSFFYLHCFASTFRKIEYSKTNLGSKLRKELAKINFSINNKITKAHLQQKSEAANEPFCLFHSILRNRIFNI